MSAVNTKLTERIDILCNEELKDRLIVLATLMGRPKAEIAREFITIQIEGLCSLKPAWTWRAKDEDHEDDGATPMTARIDVTCTEELKDRITVLSALLGKPKAELARELIKIQIDGMYALIGANLNWPSGKLQTRK